MDTATLHNRFEFAGKGRTLARLAPLLASGRVLPMQRVELDHWRAAPGTVLDNALARFPDQALMVRSSAGSEDTDEQSGAGAYDSIAGVAGRAALARAIDRVFASYGTPGHGDEVLIQPMAQDVRACGVAMTRDPETGLPYHVVNYTLGVGTDGVTSGSESVLSYVALKGAHRREPAALRGLFAMLDDVERVTGRDDLDIEFAITGTEVLLFQVRPITGIAQRRLAAPPDEQLEAAIATESARIAALAQSMRPAGAAEAASFGLMPDWNPAEMIGVKPSPLAYSLYKELITDVNWASARFRYGYRDMRDKKLMFQFCGSPYVCIPHSVESFIPAALPDDVAQQTVAACCSHLAAHRHLHDKIEFTIVPTCFTPTLAKKPAAEVAAFAGLDAAQHELYLAELRHLTRQIASPDGPFFSDLTQLPNIEQRVAAFSGAPQADPLQQFRRALTGAKIVGEVFAGAARAAFVATALLKSLELEGCVEPGFADALIGNANTIGRRLSDDFRLLSKDAFLQRHGHVRPGTYDLRVPRYDEAPDAYFDWHSPLQRPTAGDVGAAADRRTTMAIQRCFDECDLQLPAAQFLEFVGAAIGARENVKYLYGAFVSEALRSLGWWGERHGLSRDDLGFTTLADLGGDAGQAAQRVSGRLASHRARWELTRDMRMPAVICGPEDLSAHDVQACHPNFITRGGVDGPVTVLSAHAAPPADLEGHIVLIESADPGFDWIFTRRIAGFVTAYGGENSHMSIRAREFSMPAAIGVGEATFRSLSLGRRIRLDCSARRLQVLS